MRFRTCPFPAFAANDNADPPLEKIEEELRQIRAVKQMLLASMERGKQYLPEGK